MDHIPLSKKFSLKKLTENLYGAVFQAIQENSTIPSYPKEEISWYYPSALERGVEFDKILRKSKGEINLKSLALILNHWSDDLNMFCYLADNLFLYEQRLRKQLGAAGVKRSAEEIISNVECARNDTDNSLIKLAAADPRWLCEKWAMVWLDKKCLDGDMDFFEKLGDGIRQGKNKAYPVEPRGQGRKIIKFIKSLRKTNQNAVVPPDETGQKSLITYWHESERVKNAGQLLGILERQGLISGNIEYSTKTLANRLAYHNIRLTGLSIRGYLKEICENKKRYAKQVAQIEHLFALLPSVTPS